MVFINEKPLFDLIFQNRSKWPKMAAKWSKNDQKWPKMIGKPWLVTRKAYFGPFGLFCVKNATNKMDSPMKKSGQDGIWGPKLKLKHVKFGLLVRMMKFRRISTVHLRNNHDQFLWTNFFPYYVIIT